MAQRIRNKGSLCQFDTIEVLERSGFMITSDDINQTSLIPSNAGCWPYRLHKSKHTSLPRYHSMAKPGNHTETFSGSLRMLGHGTRLWETRGNLTRLEAHPKSGMSSSDTASTSSYPQSMQFRFDVLPIQYPLDSELSVDPMYFPAGTVLTSTGIEMSTISTSPLDIRLTIHAREGAVFVLRDGASREDVIDTARIESYVQKHHWNDIYFNEGGFPSA